MFRMGDGFDAHTSTADVLKKWNVLGDAWAFNATAGVLGGGALVCAGATANLGARMLPTLGPSGATQQLGWTLNSVQGCFAFWLKVSAPPAATGPLITTLNTSAASHQPIRINTSGGINLYDSGGSVIATGTTNVCDNIWHWIEIKFGPSNIGGSNICTCYVDGIVQWNSASFSTQTSSVDFVYLSGLTSRTMTVDDYLVYDSLGTGLMASAFPLGQLTCLTKWPNADSVVQFNRSTGADNYALVDETSPSVADYVESATSGQQDLYDFPNIGFTPSSIKAVVANAYAHNPNAGTIGAKLIAKNSATQVDGTTVALATNPRIYQQHFDTDPNGAIAWSGSGFDSTKFGIKVP